jgi:large subunit ribosomal protein L32
MAVPKKKTSPSRRNMRRSHHALKKTNVVENQTTGEQSLPHHVSADGYYRGRQVFVPRNRTSEAAE